VSLHPNAPVVDVRELDPVGVVVAATGNLALSSCGERVDPWYATEYDSNGNSAWLPEDCGYFPVITDKVALYQVPKYMASGTVGFWMTSWFLDSDKTHVFGSNWYDPSPTSQTINNLDWTWEDASVLFYCSWREILWGNVTVHIAMGSDVIEGDAVLDDHIYSNGGSEDERNPYTTEGGSWECYEVWYVWPDGYEEYSGDDFCYEADES
jgi:hypothetical protein